MAIKITSTKSTPVISIPVESNRRTSITGVKTSSQTQTSTTLSGLEGVDTTGVQNGYTLVYDSSTGNWEAAPASDVAANIQVIDGGSY